MLPRTLHSILDELSTVIAQLDVQGQIVLVGHSFGSLIVRTYAARHPRNVAGIVLIDPPIEWLTMTRDRARMLRGGRFLARTGALLAHLGIVRACLALLTGGAPGAARRFVTIFGPTAARTLARLVGEVQKLPRDVHPVLQALWCQPKCFQAMAAHLLAFELEGASLIKAVPPPDVPVVVISGGDQPAEVIAAHRMLVERSVHGRHLIAERSAHWVQFDEPELIVAVVRDLVESRRT